MGLFGNMFKKKEPDFGLPTDSGGLPNDNMGLDNKDPSLDNGLDNSMGLGNPQGDIGEEKKFDSFGNPSPQRTFSEPINQPIDNSLYGSGNSPPSDISKDIQIMMAKLDAIKSEVTTINHRLEMLERQNNPPGQKKYVW